MGEETSLPLTTTNLSAMMLKNLKGVYKMKQNLHSRRYMYMYYRRICL